MNARTSLITATLTLALIIPAAASAGSRTVPWDAPLSKQTASHKHTLKANSSALGTSVSNARAAYVYGGASQKVAKAIAATAAVNRQALKADSSALGLGAYNAWASYVHGGASQKVAKAITATANRTPNVCANDAQRPVPC